MYGQNVLVLYLNNLNPAFSGCLGILCLYLKAQLILALMVSSSARSSAQTNKS